jgi:hypothetical protein
MKMEQTECSETSAYKIQTPGNYPVENIQQVQVSWFINCEYFPHACRSKKIAYVIHTTKNVRLANLHTLEKPRIFEMRSWHGTGVSYLFLVNFSIWYICWLQLGWHPVAVVQYTFTHKQYTEQQNRRKQYIEQHTSQIRKSADRAPSLRGMPWHYNWGKITQNLSEGSRRVPVGKEYTEQGIIVQKRRCQ